ncbi:hypothetical protein N312_13499, partial [Balearica regulorum gibbericeps]
GSPQTVHHIHLNPGNSDSNTYQSIQQMRNAMEKEIKSERTRGNGRELAFTLMPLYALGVGVFAAYKFLKMKSHEESLSKKEKNTEDKAKETASAFRTGAASSTDRENVEFFIDSVGSTVKL